MVLGECMKSKILKIRNLPQDKTVMYTLQAKPFIFLMTMMIVSIFIAIFNATNFLYAIVIFLVALFAIVFMPDSLILQFMKEYMVIYHNLRRNECYLVYYDEIKVWQYQWSLQKDYLYLQLIDDAEFCVECFNRRKVKAFLKQCCPNKELKKEKKV